MNFLTLESLNSIIYGYKLPDTLTTLTWNLDGAWYKQVGKPELDASGMRDFFVYILYKNI